MRLLTDASFCKIGTAVDSIDSLTPKTSSVPRGLKDPLRFERPLVPTAAPTLAHVAEPNNGAVDSCGDEHLLQVLTERRRPNKVSGYLRAELIIL